MQIAKRQAVVNPENTFFSVKRFIGRKMEEVGDESKQVPYPVSRGGGSRYVMIDRLLHICFNKYMLLLEYLCVTL